ncbi:(deoxy)nucleoside triphosphate pyrophosphohydrolase [Flavobacterium wongokense]|uniref:(deoxy)nucleoside triphosphate pyrophosphohydrolase n=1 Tax=Flavobacterium wongokense TaxID=2910674 RepID=UPI001F192903|nr:(deoxy)nucleoside triphosphate pyrophosphohydrolase [Flavobacterium sp. WG47]MCF6132323.1 (deoxy)nucleoside triphosphate pyrophosphohydrolase [Flavobacterium sp. WG47]
MKTIAAVSAIIYHGKKFLCVQKGANKYDYIAYKYEFPGGKVEEGETHEAAVIREIKEELQMDVTIVSQLTSVTHHYPDFLLVLHNFLCSCRSAELVLTEHIDFKWLSKTELRSLDWAASDVPIVEELVGLKL